jgi:hypothetical protein
LTPHCKLFFLKAEKFFPGVYQVPHQPVVPEL